MWLSVVLSRAHFQFLLHSCMHRFSSMKAFLILLTSLLSISGAAFAKPTPPTHGLENSGQIKIFGGVYDISTGKVTILN